MHAVTPHFFTCRPGMFLLLRTCSAAVRNRGLPSWTWQALSASPIQVMVLERSMLFYLAPLRLGPHAFQKPGSQVLQACAHRIVYIYNIPTILST